MPSVSADDVRPKAYLLLKLKTCLSAETEDMSSDEAENRPLVEKEGMRSVSTEDVPSDAPQ